MEKDLGKNGYEDSKKHDWPKEGGMKNGSDNQSAGNKIPGAIKKSSVFDQGQWGGKGPAHKER